MSLLEMCLIAVGLSMDSLAVALTGGVVLGKYCKRRVLTMALIFALAQALMPLLGWTLGLSFRSLIQDVDHWIAFGILSILGIKGIAEGLKKPDKVQRLNPFEPLTLLVLALATSIDALAVGISFSVLRINIFLAITVIGILCFLICAAGTCIGIRFGNRFGNRVNLAGGAILILIGARILYEHIVAAI
ncbi:MAG: manganese efflux pump MntP family protein [Bacteroidales bacterium]